MAHLVSRSLAGALIAAAVGGISQRLGSPSADFAQLADIRSFLPALLSGLADARLTALAGAIVGFVLATGARSRSAVNGWLTDGLLLANPIAIYALAQNAKAALLLAALSIVACAGAVLAATRDYRAAVVLGLTLAIAPFLSHTLFYLYPVLAIALPFLSPWGLAPSKAAGFMVVIWSPLAMTLTGLAYLDWLLGPAQQSAPVASITWDKAYAPDILIIVAGAGLIAIASVAASRLASVLAFFAAAGLLAAAHPEWLSRF